MRYCVICWENISLRHGLAKYCSVQCLRSSSRIKKNQKSREVYAALSKEEKSRRQKRNTAWRRIKRREDHQFLERDRASSRRNYEKHRDKILVQNLSYYWQNREKILVQKSKRATEIAVALQAFKELMEIIQHD